MDAAHLEERPGSADGPASALSGRASGPGRRGPRTRTGGQDRDETDLLRRLRAGDESAFAVIVDRHHAAMVRVARAHVGNLAVAEEVVQDAWLGALRGLHAFEGRSSLRTWLFRIVVNRAITTGVRERQHVPVADSELEHESGRFSQDGWWVVPPTHWADEAVERMTAPDVVARIHELIDDLPAAQRQVVTLQDVEGLASADVCGVLGISDGNRRVLLHRARARIRRHLEQEALL